jgi:hypothetical protein
LNQFGDAKIKSTLINLRNVIAVARASEPSARAT